MSMGRCPQAPARGIEMGIAAALCLLARDYGQAQGHGQWQGRARDLGLDKGGEGVLGR